MKQLIYKNKIKKFINTKNLTYKIICTLLLSWVYALASQIYIPLPFQFIPITLQTFILFSCPLIFGKMAFYATITWILQGALGLPMFFDGSGSLTHILGPTGGYLIGFLFSSYYLSTIKTKTSKNIILFLHMTIALFILHGSGILYLSFFIPLTLGLTLFFFIDLIKILIIILLAKLNLIKGKNN
ncbi:MAG: biotin transporter BioY [bacterium]